VVVAALVLSALSLAVSAILLFLAWHVIDSLHMTFDVEKQVDNSMNQTLAVTPNPNEAPPGPYEMVDITEQQEYQNEQEMIAAGKWTKSD